MRIEPRRLSEEEGVLNGRDIRQRKVGLALGLVGVLVLAACGGGVQPNPDLEQAC